MYSMFKVTILKCFSLTYFINVYKEGKKTKYTWILNNLQNGIKLLCHLGIAGCYGRWMWNDKRWLRACLQWIISFNLANHVFVLKWDNLCNCLEVIYSNYMGGSCSIRFALKNLVDNVLKNLAGVHVCMVAKAVELESSPMSLCVL